MFYGLIFPTSLYPYCFSKPSFLLCFAKKVAEMGHCFIYIYVCDIFINGITMW